VAQMSREEVAFECGSSSGIAGKGFRYRAGSVPGAKDDGFVAQAAALAPARFFFLRLNCPRWSLPSARDSPKLARRRSRAPRASALTVLTCSATVTWVSGRASTGTAILSTESKPHARSPCGSLPGL